MKPKLSIFSYVGGFMRLQFPHRQWLRIARATDICVSSLLQGKELDLHDAYYEQFRRMTQPPTYMTAIAMAVRTLNHVQERDLLRMSHARSTFRLRCCPR